MRGFIPILVISAINVQLIGQYITLEPEVQMLALGDSYTIGESVETSERWPHQLIAELRASDIAANDPDYIATTGWTTGNLLQGIDSRLDVDKEYNLVSILIGVNNQYQGIDISTYEPDLRKIIDRALEIVDQDTTNVFMLSIPDYAYTPFGNESVSISQAIDAYNAINNRIAGEYEIGYVNITPISREGLENPDLVAGDGLHPSGLQYGEWVKKILPYLRISTTLSLSSHKTKTSASHSLRVASIPDTSNFQVFSERALEILRIYSSSGKLLREFRVSQNPVQLDLSFLASGFYLLEAFHEDRCEVTKLVLD